MSDLFFLGAGFSRAMLPNMPLLGDLTEYISKHEAGLKWRSFGNVEQILNYLSEHYPWEQPEEYFRKRADFFAVARLVGNEICERQLAHPVDSDGGPFSDLFRRWHETRTHIITLNYDTIPEQCLGKLFGVSSADYYPVPLPSLQTRDGIGMFGGYPMPTAMFYKLHGSVNWYYSGRDNFYGEPIYHGHHPKRPVDPTEERFRRDKVPLIIPPTFQKSSFLQNETIRAIWQLAGEALSKATRIFFIGYSFPDSDLMIRNFLLAGTYYKKASIVVVDPSNEVYRKVEKLFDGVATVTRFEQNGTNPALEFAQQYCLGNI